MITLDAMISAYEKHKNLKLAAEELGMKFQNLYYHLKKAGISVTGDKERYGSDKDKFAAKCEGVFSLLVPESINQNKLAYQSKIDFLVNGIGVDVKGAKIQKPGRSPGGHRWMFSIKKQLIEAEFFVLMGFDDADTEKPKAIYLVPSELIAAHQSISISCFGKSKWHAYEIDAAELSDTFKSMR